MNRRFARFYMAMTLGFSCAALALSITALMHSGATFEQIRRAVLIVLLIAGIPPAALLLWKHRNDSHIDF